MSKPDLTAERLRELLNYDPSTGVFTWLENRGATICKAKIAGTITNWGYRIITINKRNYRANRLAWLYVNSVWPNVFIDHIDGVRTNNAINNLREVTNSGNIQNLKKARKNSLSGLLGVCTRGNRITAEIHLNGVTTRLGRFNTPEEAHQAYLQAKRKLHPACTI
jgi:hypothetical protein